ncbi:hypothetical protein GQR58_004523 [Nymphon striatum]|nr:hypothetical protein GQR58_004523 [Nymphon striatum]
MPADLFSTFGLSTSALGTAFGLGAFGVFTKYMNYNTAAWGLVGGPVIAVGELVNLSNPDEKVQGLNRKESNVNRGDVVSYCIIATNVSIVTNVLENINKSSREWSRVDCNSSCRYH